MNHPAASPPKNACLAAARNACRRGFSTPHRHHQLSKADYIEHPPEIVGERGQAELAANLLQATHQERPLVHPLFDCAEWMLHHLAALLEYLRTLRQSGLHAVEHGLVLHAGHGTKAIRRASRPDRAIVTRPPVGVVDLLEPAQDR